MYLVIVHLLLLLDKGMGPDMIALQIALKGTHTHFITVNLHYQDYA